MTYSHDGHLWRRPSPRQPAIAPSNAAGLFPTYVSCSAPLELGDELWLYYTEANGAHPKTPFSEAVSQIRAAVWRKDGFASLEVDSCKPGAVITPPLLFTGKRLLLNAETAEVGGVSVEVQDADGSPLPGLAAQDCDILKGDFTAGEVTWHGQADLSHLAGKAIRLQIVFGNGAIYSFRFSE